MNLNYGERVRNLIPKCAGVYAILFENGVKIGKAKDLSERVGTYCSPWCRDIKDFTFVKCENCDEVEKKALELLREIYRLEENSTEFFKVTKGKFKKIERLLIKCSKMKYEKRSPESVFDTLVGISNISNHS